MSRLSQRKGKGTCRAALLVGVLVVAGGCTNGVHAKATRARGPDGAEDWWRVTCRHDHDECVAKAAELCGERYEVARNKGRYDVGPGFPYYSGVLLIRCKDGGGQIPEGK